MNMTQEKLAEKLDISTSFLSRLENGNSVAGLETYCEICQALNVTLDYLTEEIVPAAKRKQCERVFLDAISGMNPDEIDYLLKVINTFADYVKAQK